MIVSSNMTDMVAPAFPAVEDVVASNSAAIRVDQAAQADMDSSHSNSTTDAECHAMSQWDTVCICLYYTELYAMQGVACSAGDFC